MEIFLNLTDQAPLYQQIRDQVVVGLARGDLNEGDSLPATRKLAADFGINFHTVNKAYDILRQEGIVRLNRKTGALIVLDKTPPDFKERFLGTAEVWLAEAIVKGLSPHEILGTCKSILESFTAPSRRTGAGEGGEVHD